MLKVGFLLLVYLLLLHQGAWSMGKGGQIKQVIVDAFSKLASIIDWLIDLDRFREVYFQPRSLIYHTPHCA
jgi:hypothetical protein